MRRRAPAEHLFWTKGEREATRENVTVEIISCKGGKMAGPLVTVPRYSGSMGSRYANHLHGTEHSHRPFRYWCA